MDKLLAENTYKTINLLLTKAQPAFQAKVQQAAMKALFLLSVYNFEVVIPNVCSHMLPQSNPPEDEIIAQLTLLQHINLNSTQLSDVLKKIENAIQVYKKDKIQILLANVIRKIIWNWIDNYSIEFVTLCQTCKKIIGMFFLKIFFLNNFFFIW